MGGDLVVGVLRLAHALSAATWLGGTLSLLLWQRSHPEISDARVVTKALQVAIGVLVVTGTILAFSRLSSAALPPLYFGLLGAKVVLGLCMFGAGRGLGSRKLVWGTPWRSEPIVLVLGSAVYGLAIALRAVYEGVIRQ